MTKAITNILFTKNRPLQLEAYLESLYRYFPSNLIQSYIIYKEELFKEEYEQVFRKYNNCIVVREKYFHNDFMRILNQVQTKYTLFGVDDVVYFDAVDFNLIDETFMNCPEDIFGFSLRFSVESLKNSSDVINESIAANQKIYYIDWTKGQTPNTRYPFELCATIYRSELVKKIIRNSMTHSYLIQHLFNPNGSLIGSFRKKGFIRKLLKSFGLFYNPNTLESWPCRWCKEHSDQFPKHIYFQKLCASAVQLNMVNDTQRKTFDDSDGYTIESLAQKYKQGYKLDIDFITNNKPTSTHCGLEHFKLKQIYL
jgi:hypothetical protein